MYKQTTEKSLEAETQDMCVSGEHEKKMERLERKVGIWKNGWYTVKVAICKQPDG